MRNVLSISLSTIVLANLCVFGGGSPTASYSLKDEGTLKTAKQDNRYKRLARNAVEAPLECV